MRKNIYDDITKVCYNCIEYNYSKNLIKKQFNIKKSNYEKIKKLAKKHKKSMSWIVDLVFDRL